MSDRLLGHFVGGVHLAGNSGCTADVFNPDTGSIRARVPLASAAEVAHAVGVAEAAQRVWAAVNPQRRARVLAQFIVLVNENLDELAALLSSEHGKTIEDSKGDLQRGIEVIEFSVGGPHLLKGEYSDGIGRGIDVYSMRQPLGVVATITPFNFPAMIPLFAAGPALAAGNAMILKPSERNPSVPLRLAELFTEAGLPDGVLNVVNGDKEAVDALLDDDRIKAVSFVGSTPIAQYIYARATANGKRAQCFGGAKNHMIIMPDADLDVAADALIGAGYGSAGERCMAISVAVPVGRATADALAAKLTERVKALRVGPSVEATSDYGPLITSDAVERVTQAIATGVEEGADLLVDGRDHTVPGHENGFYLGPTLFTNVTPAMRIYQEEVFGPVLIVVPVDDYDEALELPSSHEYGNGVSIFTRDGAVARDFGARVNVGMVGINIPIPVPAALYSFSGWKRSAFGDLGQYGPDAFRFYTKTKVITSRWPEASEPGGASFVMPTSHH